MNSKELMNKAADNIRILTAAMVEKAKSGHPGGAMGGADFINVLYSEFLEYDPENPFWEEREETFHAARQYLVRVRELTQKITLLKSRIAYREDDLFSDDSYGVVGAEQLEKELANAERELKIAKIGRAHV